MDRHSEEAELRRLMTVGLEGDAAAHKALLGRLSGHLRAYFRRHLGRINRGMVEAEDLVQEVLLAVHTRRHTYDPSQLFTPWVYAIARYKFLDYLRRTNARPENVGIEEAIEVVARDDHTAVESTFDIDKLMGVLSPKTREAIQYVKLDGLSVAEAAARSGMSESAVKVSVHRGLKVLARLIGKERRE